MDKERSKESSSSAGESKPLSQGLRILRLAESLGLKADTLRNLKAKLLPDTSGVKAAPANMPGIVTAPMEFVPERYPVIERLTDIVPSANAGAARPQEDRPPPVEAVTKAPPAPTHAPRAAAVAHSSLDQALEAELRLRKKIESEQSWTSFRVEAWQLYERFPRPDMAARLAELAFLYGSVNELEDVLASLAKQSIEFMPLIDIQLRSHMVVKLWQAKRFQLLDSILFRKDLLLRHIPVERLYCCWSYIERGQSEHAYKLYHRHHFEIMAAQKQFGNLVRKSENELALVLGRTALQMEDEARSLSLLESIPASAPEFHKALDLLLELRVERDEQGLCAFGQKLSRELDWKNRIGLLDSFLLRMQRIEHSVPRDRAALNALLADPLRWFPETPEAWQMLSELLLQYSNLEFLLPNILRTFSERATQYYKSPFEHALWSPLLDHDFRDPVKTWYWRSIAMVHEFAWGLGQKEERLWEARHEYQEALQHHGKSLPLTWQRIHRGLMNWVHKSERLDDNARVKLSLVVKLVGESKDLSEQDISSYLLHVPQPPREVMRLLENLARDRQQWGLELFILDRKAQSLHHTNQTLERTWQLATQIKRYDLAWRAASVLKARQALSPELERHWAISGEKKRDFPLLELNEAQLKKLSGSFEGYERRLVEAVLQVGPLIPELLAGLNPHMVPVKKAKGMSQLETEVQDALDKMAWMPSTKKLFSPNPNGLWQPKPPFFSNLLDSKWSLLFVSLAQRFGVSAWEWQLSLLNQQIEAVVPKMARGAEETGTGKVGRWLRALTPQQRKAWYELAHLSKRFDDEKAQEVLGRFILRFTTTIHQDHLMALQSLEKMRAPLRLRWDLENWILSETYGEIRKLLGIQASTSFPETVYRLRALAEKEEKTL